MLRVTAIALLVVAALAAAVPVCAAIGDCDPHACCPRAQARMQAATDGCCPTEACVESAPVANQRNRDFETVPRVSIVKLSAVTPAVFTLVPVSSPPTFDSGLAASPPSSRARLAQLATLLI